jgi:hypothetical protein
MKTALQKARTAADFATAAATELVEVHDEIRQKFIDANIAIVALEATDVKEPAVFQPGRQCPVPLRDGTRCPNECRTGYTRCEDHYATSGMVLTPNQRLVLKWLTGHASRPHMTARRIQRAERGLESRHLIDDKGRPTDWGKDIAGRMRR